ncbi:hypothetical protein [Sphingobium aquiterrae]|uniref:polysaccharide deacetylase family protein n=1 Tax=Sphingobium aquiterrae TaxID=2038656 RepID=UPI0030196231
MTSVLITIDTELSAALQARGASARANVDSSIGGRAKGGAWGIGWQMDLLERHGLKGIFFVDPMPALAHGPAWLEDIVRPIVARGHEVQLHIHTEWLEWAAPSPVGGRRGRNLADFSLADQTLLLRLAHDLLVQAGAPTPSAFRAGNYGANDDSLRALASLGIAWDSSVNPAYLGRGCAIGVDAGIMAATRRLGIIELPVSGIEDRPGGFRPAQVCAMSAREMRAALDHAAATGVATFVIVTHSFEMLSRDRQRPNRAVIRRFEALCAHIAAHPGLKTAGFGDLDPALADRRMEGARLGPSRARTALRIAAQAVATWRYEHRLKPA